MMPLMARRVNVALLVLLAGAFFSGWVAFSVVGWGARLVLVGHALVGLGLVVLVPWKSVVARRGFARRRGSSDRSRWVGVVLGVVLGGSLVAGVLHAVGVPWWGPVLTAMDLHVGLAVVAVPLVVWHVMRRPVAVRRADLSRRAVLRSGVVIGASAGVWALAEVGERVARLPGAGRALTGSYEVGSFQPVLMPVSSWTIDPIPSVDVSAWRVVVAGRTYLWDEVDSFGDRVRAVLDCTGGFWSEQDWAGARLSRLLPPGDPALAGAGSVRVVSATGYERRFALDDLASLILATRVGGEALSPGHGFPARLVVPGRRGFWWVKWVVRVAPDAMPWWWQSPFPIH